MSIDHLDFASYSSPLNGTGKALTLYELNRMLRQVVEIDMPDEYWVQAELSEVREVRGHCFMELIQKDEFSNTPVAKASAKCWNSSWMMIRPNFERVTGQRLHPGMKVLLRVQASFHEAYGFSWIITDIDPTFTLGDMARKRQEIIKRLKDEGVFELQKELQIPMFAQCIAVISSENAAGYGDFCNQLTDNEYGFKFHTQLFPAVMQGEKVEQSVIAALNRINDIIDDFDAVVIIRGGGATSDMSGFDTLALAENVANFPLPIITGIGHDRDESVLDMISNTRVKTPTAAAALLINNLVSTSQRITEARDSVLDAVQRRMEKEQMRLERLSADIPRLFSVVKTQQESRLDRLANNLFASVGRYTLNASHHLEILSQNIEPIVERKILNEQHRLEMLNQRMDAVNPERLLQRGYSITLYQGKSVRDPKSLKSGDEIETKMAKGKLISIIK
jgi:exodeoxyribonuclease VII large subunit